MSTELSIDEVVEAMKNWSVKDRAKLAALTVQMGGDGSGKTRKPRKSKKDSSESDGDSAAEPKEKKEPTAWANFTGHVKRVVEADNNDSKRGTGWHQAVSAMTAEKHNIVDCSEEALKVITEEDILECYKKYMLMSPEERKAASEERKEKRKGKKSAAAPKKPAAAKKEEVESESEEEEEKPAPPKKEEKKPAELKKPAMKKSVAAKKKEEPVFKKAVTDEEKNTVVIEGTMYEWCVVEGEEDGMKYMFNYENGEYLGGWVNGAIDKTVKHPEEEGEE